MGIKVRKLEKRVALDYHFQDIDGKQPIPLTGEE